MAPEIINGVTVIAHDERRHEWSMALDELNEELSRERATIPEVIVRWSSKGGSLMVGDDTRVTLADDSLRTLFVRYRESIKRLSRTCASGRADAERIRRMDDRKRQCHNLGAEGLRELIEPHLTLELSASRKLFSLLYLLWDQGPVSEVRHHRHHR